MSNEKQATDTLSAMLDQYTQAAAPTKRAQTNVVDLKNYFTTHLKDTEKEATKRIRILPTKDGTTPFIEFHGHKVQVEGQWRTFPCLKHEEEKPCAFCEAYDALRAQGTEAGKDLAKKYSAKKMFIVKVIDRDNEDHGVKFWRFPYNYSKQGILDKIYGVLKAVNKDITNAETGRDLLVILARDQNNRPSVQSISHVDPTPLSEDKALAKTWLEDDRTWQDVYATKPYDFLEILVRGGVPAWDKDEKKFVDKASLKTKEAEDTVGEVTLGVQNVKTTVKTAKALPIVVDPVGTDDVVDDDLPF